VFELAFLAAQLIPKNESYSTARGMDYTNMAADLWENSQMRVNKIEKEIAVAIAIKADRADFKIPVPKSFPVMLEKFLQLAMPQFPIQKRDQTYRQYIAEKLLMQSYVTEQYQNSGKSFNEIPYPTENEIDKIIADHQELKFNEKTFGEEFITFVRWLERYKTRKRAARAKAGYAAMRKKVKKAP
jgi:hypothetical protein